MEHDNRLSYRFGVDAHDRIPDATRSFLCPPAMGGTARQPRGRAGTLPLFTGSIHSRLEHPSELVLSRLNRTQLSGRHTQNVPPEPMAWSDGRFESNEHGTPHSLGTDMAHHREHWHEPGQAEIGCSWQTTFSLL